jgi:hypothetical protein
MAILLFSLLASVGPGGGYSGAAFSDFVDSFPVGGPADQSTGNHHPRGILSLADRKMLRATARRTWRYFDDFVGPGNALAAPDNVQESTDARNLPAHFAD